MLYLNLSQDLAVVVLLILIPLISPNSSKGGVTFYLLIFNNVGFQAIAEALGLAAVKAIVAIAAIIAGGRLFLRPIYKQIAENQNAEIFSANTLLVILGTSLLTARVCATIYYDSQLFYQMIISGTSYNRLGSLWLWEPFWPVFS
ncbi:hypothetical protein B296_00028605 [Ensete ventricosum]|uniref:Uncharacterized protein n=1 Tax=Ensete ventricosum TaxID=4639 RepID=A0A427AMF7_ENSVE|nr:hypothetical protein B296_00028605 [Ensete ventricosum]